MEKLVKQIKGFLPLQKKEELPWTKNWAIKLLSLFFALFLWYFVVGEDKVDMTVHIPVEIVNLPRDLVISNQFKRQLEVTVTGPRGLIRGIANQHVSRPVDLSKATPGSILVRNDEEAISFPRGIRVLRIQPPYLTLLLDRLIQRELPITPVFDGNPARGYKVASVTFEPPALSLTGPQAVLGDQVELATTAIDVHNLTNSVTREVSLDLKPTIAELIGETTVTAHVTVVEETILRRVNDLPLTIKSGNTGNSVNFSPKSVTIKAEIPISINKKTKNLQTLFAASISVADLQPGTHTVPVRVDTGALQLKIVSISPNTATVTINKITQKK